MPLGVEHIPAVSEAETRGNVSQPLMPLGVEHELRFGKTSQLYLSESTFDAVRR